MTQHAKPPIFGTRKAEIAPQEQMTLPGANLFEDDDDLFSRPVSRPLAPTARITCRVCNAQAVVPILSAGLLCDHCRANLDATEQHVRGVMAEAVGSEGARLREWGERALEEVWAARQKA